MTKTTIDELLDNALQDPLFTLEYFAQHPGTTHRTSALKQLFNHAGKPVPVALQAAPEKAFEMSRKDVANLVYRAARKQGQSVPAAAMRWLRMRAGPGKEPGPIPL